MSTLSTYTYTLDCLDAMIDFEAAVRSAAALADEVVVLDVGSTDGTRERLEELSREVPELRVFDGRWDNSDRASDWKSWKEARARCTSDWAMIWAADWAMRESDAPVLRDIMKDLEEAGAGPGGSVGSGESGVSPVLVFLPIANLWRNPGSVEATQILHHCLAPNLPDITHGFWKGNTPEPGSSTTYSDSDSKPVADWAKSDGCEFIRAGTRDLLPAVYIAPDWMLHMHQAFMQGALPPEVFAPALEHYFNTAPTIFHYGGLSPARKARWYRRASERGLAWNQFNLDADTPEPGETYEVWLAKMEARKGDKLIRGLSLKHPVALEAWQKLDPPPEDVFPPSMPPPHHG